MKKTKIVATVSDFKATKEYIQDLVDAGVNVVRLNTAHMDYDGATKVIEATREVSDKVAILIDTKGPEVRTFGIEESIPVETGETIYMKSFVDENAKSDNQTIYTSYADFVKDVPIGNPVLIDDGDIELVVESKDEEKLICKVVDGGAIANRKSVNVPGVSIKLPSLTEKDLGFINYSIENNIDFIAHSFVRNKQDVLDIQKILDEKNSPIQIISKIENQEGVENIDEILDVSWGAMVARGDLAIEMPAEKIPKVTRDIVNKCIQKRKTVIVATQMLHTMIESPRPTRAEVSDVATAILIAADAIMLSGETAYGKYGVEAVKVMSKIAKEMEKERVTYRKLPTPEVAGETATYLAEATVRGSKELDLKACVTDTLTGNMARNLASFRGDVPIYAQCYKEHVMRKLSLTYGVYPEHQKRKSSKDKYIKSVTKSLVNRKLVKKEDMIAILGGRLGVGTGTSFLEFLTPEHAKEMEEKVNKGKK